MSNEPESISSLDTISKTPLSDSIQQLFSRLRSSDVEQFINAYQLWTLHQEIDLLNLQIALTQQELLSNEEQLHLSQPTAIEQAALAQLQSSGVSDIDLLDRMHARGELWLDNALQLLEHCERLDMIQGNYTQWCEHALEGAYDWLSSIDDDDLSQAQPADIRITEPVESIHKNESEELSEELLLQKLFSENVETISQEDMPEAETKLPEALSHSSIAELATTSFDGETEVEDLSEQFNEALTEEPTIISAPETALAEPETNTEVAIETTEESPISEENLNASTEEPEETPDIDSFPSVSTSAPSPTQELLQNESKPAEDQEIHERSEYDKTLDAPTEPVEHDKTLDALNEPIEHIEAFEAQTDQAEEATTLEEQSEPIEHTETLDEPTEPAEQAEAFEAQTDQAEEAEETQEQPHISKRNRLVQRFVGRIFPKG